MKLLIEKKLRDQLKKLKEEYGIAGIKAEFEDEGSSYDDIVRLRHLTGQINGVPLHVKIGGVEAIRDIIDCLEIGVDNIIAPMVESPFGVVKFIGAIESVYGRQKTFKSINIESCEAVRQVDEILKVARGKIDNVTIGKFIEMNFDQKISIDEAKKIAEESCKKLLANPNTEKFHYEILESE